MHMHFKMKNYNIKDIKVYPFFLPDTDTIKELINELNSSKN